MADTSEIQSGSPWWVLRLSPSLPPASIKAILPHHPLPLLSQAMPRPLSVPTKGSPIPSALGVQPTYIIIKGSEEVAATDTEARATEAGNFAHDRLSSISQIPMAASAFILPPVFRPANDGGSMLPEGQVEEKRQPPSGPSEVGQ